MTTINGRSLSGWKKDLPDHRDQRLSAIKQVPLPARSDVKRFCPSVKDQGHIGSCVANASTAMMESRYLAAGQDAVEFSRLYLYWMIRVRIEGTPASDDSGCMIRDSMKALYHYGVCLENDWEYDTTKFAYTPPISADIAAALHKAIHYKSARSLYSIKHCISVGFPVVGGFSVPSNMMSDECAADGIVHYPKPGEGFVGGHAVLFVGYDDDKQCLTFQNSWGENWGDKGFGYLPYAFVNEGLADDFWALFEEQGVAP